MARLFFPPILARRPPETTHSGGLSSAFRTKFAAAELPNHWYGCAFRGSISWKQALWPVRTTESVKLNDREADMRFFLSLLAFLFPKRRGRKAQAALVNFDDWFSTYRRRLDETCDRKRDS